MVEVLTGLALLVAPTLVVGLLLGDGVGPIGVAVARVLGIGLLSIGGVGARKQVFVAALAIVTAEGA